MKQIEITWPKLLTFVGLCFIIAFVLHSNRGTVYMESEQEADRVIDLIAKQQFCKQIGMEVNHDIYSMLKRMRLKDPKGDRFVTSEAINRLNTQVASKIKDVQNKMNDPMFMLVAGNLFPNICKQVDIQTTMIYNKYYLF